MFRGIWYKFNRDGISQIRRVSINGIYKVVEVEFKAVYVETDKTRVDTLGM